MAKQKEILKPTQLYSQIKHMLIINGIDPNPWNIQIVLKGLNWTTDYFVDEIIDPVDINKIVLNTDNHFYTALSYSLARKNQKAIDEVKKFLSQELKENDDVSIR